MDTTSRNRWIANLVLEAGSDIPALPWSRAAKRLRRLDQLRTVTRTACA